MSFSLATGEAVNGPGGYFGQGLGGLDDCLVGGFGAVPGMTMIWTHSSRSARSLGTRYFRLIEETFHRRKAHLILEWDPRTAKRTPAPEGVFTDSFASVVEMRGS